MFAPSTRGPVLTDSHQIYAASTLLLAIPLPKFGTATVRKRILPHAAGSDAKRHRPLWPLCDAKFGRTVLSRLYHDLYIVPQRHQETHEALDRISPELTSQHS